MIEQFSNIKCDALNSPYLPDKTPKAVFHGHDVKTVAYLRVSTAQQDLRSQRRAILELGVSQTVIVWKAGLGQA